MSFCRRLSFAVLPDACSDSLHLTRRIVHYWYSKSIKRKHYKWQFGSNVFVVIHFKNTYQGNSTCLSIRQALRRYRKFTAAGGLDGRVVSFFRQLPCGIACRFADFETGTIAPLSVDLPVQERNVTQIKRDWETQYCSSKVYDLIHGFSIQCRVGLVTWCDATLLK